MKATLYRVVRLNESGELYDTQIDNLQELIDLALKEKSDQEEEIEVYGSTQQREDNISTLKDLISVLEYKLGI